MAKIRELREQRRKLITDARAICEKAESEQRDLTTEEQTRYDKHIADAGALKNRIDREERLLDEERDLGAPVARRGGREDSDPTNIDPDDPTRQDGQLTAEQRSAPHARYMQGGGPRNTRAYQSAFRSYITGGRDALSADEARALAVDPSSSGGFITAAEEFVARLIQKVDDLVFIRQMATVIPVPNADSLGAPSLETDPSDADWTSELGTGNEDSAMGFGKRSLTPHPVAKRIKVSNKLLRKATIGPEQLVRDRLAYKFGITEEKAFLTGTGAQQPLGVFTASANGISTARDKVVGGATDFTVDGLKDNKYTLKAAYWARAAWMIHRDGVGRIAKLKDTAGRYLWEDSIRQGEPDRLLGFPVRMSEYIPNTFTTGLYVSILGDFSNYWIADSLDFQLQRLVELYAASNQVGFIGRQEIDGMPVLEEAFVRGKLA